MRWRSSVKTRLRRLARLSSGRTKRSEASGTTALLADARRMRTSERKDQRNFSGSVTQNSTPSRMRRVWGHLWRAVLCLLLILPAWTALALFVRQASSVSSPSAPATTSAPVGMSTPSALPDSSKSAASRMRKFQWENINENRQSKFRNHRSH